MLSTKMLQSLLGDTTYSESCMLLACAVKFGSPDRPVLRSYMVLSLLPCPLLCYLNMCPSVRTLALKLPFLVEYSPEPLASCAAVFQAELPVQNVL